MCGGMSFFSNQTPLCATFNFCCKNFLNSTSKNPQLYHERLTFHLLTLPKNADVPQSSSPMLTKWYRCFKDFYYWGWMCEHHFMLANALKNFLVMRIPHFCMIFMTVRFILCLF